MKLYTLGSSYSISIVFEAKLMESGKWRSAVDTEDLPVNLPVELAQVRKNQSFFLKNLTFDHFFSILILGLNYINYKGKVK